MRKTLDHITNVAVIAACVVISSVTIFRNVKGAPTLPSAQRPPVDNVESRNLVTTTKNVSMSGYRKAAIAVIEFTDFECPYCGKYARDVWPKIRENFIVKGKVQYAVRNLPLPIHKSAMLAAEVAECAGAQSRYWSMHDRIFSNQISLEPSTFMSYAKALGLDQQAFKACLAGQLSSKISQDVAEAKRLGVTSTPTFVVGRVDQAENMRVLKMIKGAQPYEVFQKVLEGLL